MKKKELLEQLQSLNQKASFTPKEAADVGVSRRMLSHYLKSGDIERIGAGVYSLRQNLEGVDWKWDDLVRTMAQIPEGIVCLITALSIWELTDEFSKEFWIAIPQSKWPPRIDHVRAVKMRNLTLGRTTVQMGNFEIPIFDPERCVVDAFRLSSIEVAIKSLRYLAGKGNLNFQKLSDYSKELRVNIYPYIMALST